VLKMRVFKLRKGELILIIYIFFVNRKKVDNSFSSTFNTGLEVTNRTAVQAVLCSIPNSVKDFQDGIK